MGFKSFQSEDEFIAYCFNQKRLKSYPKRPPEIVYFVQEQGGDYRIKIGRTISLKQRVGKLRNEARYPIKVLGTVDIRQFSERELHERFDAFRHVGEWFFPRYELMVFIAQYADGYMPKKKRTVPKYKEIPGRLAWKTRLAEYAEVNEMTIDQVSYETGIPMRTLNRWLYGPLYRIETKHLLALCEYFECKLSELVYW